MSVAMSHFVSIHRMSLPQGSLVSLAHLLLLLLSNIDID